MQQIVALGHREVDMVRLKKVGLLVNIQFAGPEPLVWFQPVTRPRHQTFAAGGLSGYIQALKDIGYTGVLAIEDESGNPDMIDSIRRSYAFLREALDD